MKGKTYEIKKGTDPRLSCKAMERAHSVLKGLRSLKEFRWVSLSYVYFRKITLSCSVQKSIKGLVNGISINLSKGR